jgi:hypothetical protein
MNRMPLVIPQYGVVKGGVLDGWSFTYHTLDLDKRGIATLVVSVCQPFWPFPRQEPVRLRAKDFDALRDTSHRAPVIDIYHQTKALQEARAKCA